MQDYGTLDDASPHDMITGGDAPEPQLDGHMEHEAGIASDQRQPDEADDPQPDEQAQQLTSQNSLPTGGPKSRLRWTPKLHQLFVEALRALGGPHVATPKQVAHVRTCQGQLASSRFVRCHATTGAGSFAHQDQHISLTGCSRSGSRDDSAMYPPRSIASFGALRARDDIDPKAAVMTLLGRLLRRS